MKDFVEMCRLQAASRKLTRGSGLFRGLSVGQTRHVRRAIFRACMRH